MSEQGRKDDSAKRRYSLLPKGAVNSVVDVLEFGSKKYADNNWQKVPDAKTRYYDAAMRHIDSWWQGEKTIAQNAVIHYYQKARSIVWLMYWSLVAKNTLTIIGKKYLMQRRVITMQP